MENLKKAINLLNSVYLTMDTISVVGVDNQDKSVGCANAIRSVIRSLRQEQAEKITEDQSAGISDRSDVRDARNG